jgi:MFS family permease
MAPGASNATDHYVDKGGRNLQYGKLSDIYGRKSLLLAAYACYCVGGLLA